MKRNLLALFSLLALTACGSADNPALTVKVVPERSCILPDPAADVVFSIDVGGCVVPKSKRMPLNMAVVLDRSGSMSGAKLEQAKQAALLVVDQLQSTDIFSLVVYDSDVQVLIPAQKVTDRQRIRSRIMAINTGGSTALYEGVVRGSDQIREYFDKKRVNRVLLLSDGIANVGPSKPSDLARLGSRLVREGIHVTTIGLGDDYNEDVMVSLAEASAANYYYVQDTEKLPEIFAEELGYLQSIVARDIRIIIELPEGVEGVEVIGYPEVKFRGSKAELTLNEYYGSQQRNFLVRCRMPQAGRHGNRSVELANVRVQYRDEVAGRDAETTQKGYVNVTTDRRKSDASLNAEVSKQSSWYRNVAVREEALALADAGKSKEAAGLLRRQAEYNTALPAAAKDEKLMADNDALVSTASQLESDGSLDKRSRKEFQYDSYNYKKQKN